jgi:putative transposase
MMGKRRVVPTYETVRGWCSKFGGAYAKRIRSRGPRRGDRWHLDEVFLKIKGRLQSLWRVVDQDGEVLDILVQLRREKRATKRFFRKLPRESVVRSARDHYRQIRQLRSSQGRGATQRKASHCEVAKQPSEEFPPGYPRTGTAHAGLQIPGHAKRFLSVCGVNASFFHPGRHPLAAVNHREIMRRRFTQWRELISLQKAI